MARARNIKPSFFTHDELANNDPLGRLLFIGLWTIADHKGDLEWRPKRVKAQLLPYDECNIELLAINLEKTGFIRFYSVNGCDYIHIVNFCRHQNPHKNEVAKGSDIPCFTDVAENKSIYAIDSNEENKESGKIEINHDKDGTNRADSFFLIPDSCSLIPDTGNLIAEPKDLLSSDLDGDVKQVIGLLNSLTGARYKASAKTNTANISARLNDGHSLDDLLAVVRFKCAEWLHDPKMSQYLRPGTLFQPGKFDGYLTATRAAQGPLAEMSAISRKNAQNLAGDW